MIAERDENGVRVRADGKGDGWAKAHRSLGQTFNMTDFDGVMGLVAYASNTGDKLFMEYVPDNYANRFKRIRQFAYVAMFDRKTTRACAFGDANTVSLSVQLDHCRRLGQTQPHDPKFFFVVGRDAPPWELIELDIQTGEECGARTLASLDTRAVWEVVGLVDLRDALRRWIDPSRESA